jgi:hypothetical protein
MIEFSSSRGDRTAQAIHESRHYAHPYRQTFSDWRQSSRHAGLVEFRIGDDERQRLIV